LAIPAEEAPENSAPVFLVFCGVSALGKRLAAGDHSQFARLRNLAGDPRWRVREAVAIALQYAGDADLAVVLREMRQWCKGSWYEKRAAAAALAEPRLLTDTKSAEAVLSIMDLITDSMATSEARHSVGFKTLRKSMGYCWSVAITASPGQGKALFEKWITSRDRDVRWIVKQNLKKNRLIKLEPQWVKASMARVTN
jgi:hypothetical protein